MTTERTEALMRIVVGIVSGIILCVWKYFIAVLFIVNFIYTIFSGRRLKELAEMSETWNTQWYIFQRYMTFVNNRRPFPFTHLSRSISRFEK